MDESTAHRVHRPGAPHEPGPDCCAGHDPAAGPAFVVGSLEAVARAAGGPTEEGTRRRTRDLLRHGADAISSAATVDVHAHPGAFHRPRTGELPLAALDEMRVGGVDAACFAISTDGPVIHRYPGGGIRQSREPVPGQLYRDTVMRLERVLVRAREGRVQLVLAPADLGAIRACGVPGALIAFEGADALEGDLARVQEFHRLGVRSIQLVHYRINELGDIQTEAARHGGLTAFGGAVVGEMNRLRMVVDGAHASPDTLRGILAASRYPVMVSHTGPAALRPDVRRHLPDDLLREVAAGGGLIGIWPHTRTAAGVEQLVAEVEYVRRLVGSDHVAIGTDMAGLTTFTSMPTYREFAPLPAAFLAHGFTEPDVRKVLGGNFARLLAEVALG